LTNGNCLTAAIKSPNLQIAREILKQLPVNAVIKQQLADCVDTSLIKFCISYKRLDLIPLIMIFKLFTYETDLFSSNKIS